jgi:putative starch synthase
MNNNYTNGSVPVSVVAKVYGKDASWVRAGIIAGWLPIGIATRNGMVVTDVKDINSKLGRINFYISPKLLFEETGYIWRGER